MTGCHRRAGRGIGRNPGLFPVLKRGCVLAIGYGNSRIAVPRRAPTQVDATPGPPATGLRRWGGPLGSGDLGRNSPGHNNPGFALEQVPERLVIDLVVVLHLGGLDKGSQIARGAIGRGLLEIDETALHVFAQDLRNPG